MTGLTGNRKILSLCVDGEIVGRVKVVKYYENNLMLTEP